MTQDVLVTGQVTSQELGLAAGLLVGRELFDTDELHFGYWDPGVEVKIVNMRAAQERYSEFLLAHVPREAKDVLDVGCGAGKFTERLVRAGHRVEALCPSPLLAREAARRLGSAARVHEAKLEDFEGEARFDLVLFAESFQYVPLAESLPRSARLLRPGGQLLICDYFARGRRAAECQIRGGHDWDDFEQQLARAPFESLLDLDITERTAPTQDISNDACVRLLGPLLGLGRASLRNRRAVLSRLAEWRLKKWLAKVERKYLSGVRDSAHFARHLTYRLLLYRQV